MKIRNDGGVLLEERRKLPVFLDRDFLGLANAGHVGNQILELVLRVDVPGTVGVDEVLRLNVRLIVGEQQHRLAGRDAGQLRAEP